MKSLPRLVIAAPASGHGKTTIATGLMAALRDRGLAVSGHKVGPDFIDPSYHALATGRPARNLDPYLQGEERLVPLLLHGAAGADLAVIEGVMGLFDGALGTDGYASTAHVAKLLGAPVVLVVDASAASRSVAALVHGFASYDKEITLAGVILNKLGSQRHSDEICRALTPTGIPVLGALRRSDAVHSPSRHLGLVPVAERAREASSMLAALADWVAGGVDLEAVVRVARTAEPLAGERWSAMNAPFSAPRAPNGAFIAPRPVVATAAGPAFTFRYTETVELLAAAGVDVVDLDPLTSDRLPENCAGLYLGGGFPEVHAAELSANLPLRHQVATAAQHGMPIAAECAGLLYLCQHLDGTPMTGVLPATARMTDRGALGYRTATAPADTLLVTTGQQVTGHEFHRTEVNPRHGANPAWHWDGAPEGFATMTVHASYLHVHWAGHPALAARFATAVHRYAAAPTRAR